MTTDLQETFNRQRADNLAVLTGWVENASGGFLTAELGSHYNLVLVRSDGEPLTPLPIEAGHTITGVQTSIFVGSGRKLSYRNKITSRDVRDSVRSLLVKRYWNDEAGEGSTTRFAMAMSNFEWRAGIR